VRGRPAVSEDRLGESSSGGGGEKRVVRDRETDGPALQSDAGG